MCRGSSDPLVGVFVGGEKNIKNMERPGFPYWVWYGLKMKGPKLRAKLRGMDEWR